MANPYQDLSAGHFWRSGVAALEPRAVMPIPAKRFPIAGAVVATAGSCFAQELGKHIAASSAVTLLRAEPAGPGEPLFSARYGNIYSVRQLVQLFDRAFGAFAPEDGAWERDDGRYVDPFRPYISRDGFATPEDVAAARAAHLDTVRRMFRECSVFVFTLGLTEAWRAKADGAVFPIAPGVVSGRTDPARYEFHNFTYAEAAADVNGFVARLQSVNPAARIILTVSPVPLTATYTDEHVLVATTHSKAILRAVCSQAEAEFAHVFYFPSYEIITGNHSRGRYYDSNLRTVTQDGVAHVMAVFEATYLAAAPAMPPAGAAAARAAASETLDTPICDEEEIEKSIGFEE